MNDAWSARADAYRQSPTHREGADLDALVAWCDAGPDVDALDVATGGGHVRTDGLSALTTLSPWR